MLIKTYLSVDNIREPFEKMGQPGCEPKAFLILPRYMQQLCDALEVCTAAHEQTEVCFGDTLEVIPAENFDRFRFIELSKEIFDGGLISSKALLGHVEASN